MRDPKVDRGSTARRVLIAAGLAVLVGAGLYIRPLLQDPDLPRKPWGWKLEEATEEGELTYRMMCQTCHGENGDGKGPSAATLAIQPRDFTDSDYMKTRSDWRLYHTIREGGEAVGLSSAMPSWKDAVPERQILERRRPVGRPARDRTGARQAAGSDPRCWPPWSRWRR